MKFCARSVSRVTPALGNRCKAQLKIRKLSSLSLKQYMNVPFHICMLGASRDENGNPFVALHPQDDLVRTSNAAISLIFVIYGIKALNEQ